MSPATVQRKTEWKPKERTCVRCSEMIPEGVRKCQECNRRYTRARRRTPEHQAYMREYNKRNRSKTRSRHLQNRYGITLEEFNAMFAEQDGLCAVCRKPETAKWMGTDRTRPLSVDHCHETGKVRGLLCHSCNRILGLLNDDPDRLRRALAYLEEVAK